MATLILCKTLLLFEKINVVNEKLKSRCYNLNQF